MACKTQACTSAVTSHLTEARRSTSTVPRRKGYRQQPTKRIAVGGRAANVDSPAADQLPHESLPGLDNERLTFTCQERHFRLTDVHGSLIRPILLQTPARGGRAAGRNERRSVGDRGLAAAAEVPRQAGTNPV